MVAAAAKRDALEGRRLGRYVLRGRVAQGGMASIYLGQLAAAHGFEKWVAVKVIHPHLAESQQFIGMFFDEARVAARIDHPNVCSVLDFGEEDGLVYLVMEYMHGEVFWSLMRHGAKHGGLPPWLAGRVVADAARGLHAAHELRDPQGNLLGVVHRDVSPQNIHVLYDGFSKVLDFGVARARGRITATSSGQVKGKFPYMSPEQLESGAVDRRSDVWSLGVVLWEATVGRRLFRGDSEGGRALAVMRQRIPPPSEIVPGYPPDLERIVMAALERDVERRTGTAGAVADALERFLLDSGELAGPAQVSEWMNRVFAERRAERERMLRSDVSAAPVQLDIQSDSSFGTLREGPASDDAAVEPVAADDASGAPAPTPKGSGGRRRLAVGVLAAAGAVALGVGAWWVLAGPSTAPRAASASQAGEAGGAPADEAPVEQAQPGTPDERAAEAPADTDGEQAASGSDRTSDDAAEDDAAEEVAETDETDEAQGGETATEQRTARRKRARRRSAAAREPGLLNLLAIPPATVHWRGRSLGETPLVEQQMPPGRHRLTLKPVSGGEPKQVVVRIESGEHTRRSVSLQGAP